MRGIDIGIIIMAAIGIVGCMEWLKGWLKYVIPKTTVPNWVWSALMPVLCIGTALFALDGGRGAIVLQSLILIAVCELGYTIIVQSVPGLIQAAISAVLPSKP